jgi:ATP-dependent 26S proteasome regulatory subunit
VFERARAEPPAIIFLDEVRHRYDVHVYTLQ